MSDPCILLRNFCLRGHTFYKLDSISLFAGIALCVACHIVYIIFFFSSLSAGPFSQTKRVSIIQKTQSCPKQFSQWFDTRTKRVISEMVSIVKDKAWVVLSRKIAVSFFTMNDEDCSIVFLFVSSGQYDHWDLLATSLGLHLPFHVGKLNSFLTRKLVQLIQSPIR